MQVLFEEDYLKELYEQGEANDKLHRFQPQIEFREITQDEKAVAEIVSITELSNHYK